MAVRPCLTCGALSRGSRCPTHTAANQRATDARRGTATQRGYDSAWRRLVAEAIRLHPWCSDCGTTKDLTGDHLRWPALTLADVQVVCRPCNSRRPNRRSRTR